MRSIIALAFLTLVASTCTLAMDTVPEQASGDVDGVTWKPGVAVETLWENYTKAKGGLTWAKSASYPDYSRVNEGDTFMAELKQGPCLMEFFHSRWRRANDVRRWHDSVNAYGGCPYVFD